MFVIYKEQAVCRAQTPDCTTEISEPQSAAFATTDNVLYSNCS